MAIYTQATNADGIQFIVRDNADGTETWIPCVETNSDYQVYLATLASELSNPSTPQAGE